MFRAQLSLMMYSISIVHRKQQKSLSLKKCSTRSLKTKQIKRRIVMKIMMKKMMIRQLLFRSPLRIIRVKLEVLD
jgi:hypothetical protein